MLVFVLSNDLTPNYFVLSILFGAPVILFGVLHLEASVRQSTILTVWVAFRWPLPPNTCGLNLAQQYLHRDWLSSKNIVKASMMLATHTLSLHDCPPTIAPPSLGTNTPSAFNWIIFSTPLIYSNFDLLRCCGWLLCRDIILSRTRASHALSLSYTLRATSLLYNSKPHCTLLPRWPSDWLSYSSSLHGILPSHV